MNSRHILMALATAGLMVGGQALAQGRGGGHGGGHGAGGVGMGAGGTVRGGLDRMGPNTDIMRGRMDTRNDITTGTRVGRDFGVRSRTDARVDSQGPANASARARARANDNSVLATGRVTSDLSLLRDGLVVRDSTGAELGTIARINRTGDGRIVNVLVRDEDGRSRTIPVAPNSLSISSDIVTVLDMD